jgi:hypothetical protein
VSYPPPAPQQPQSPVQFQGKPQFPAQPAYSAPARSGQFSPGTPQAPVPACRMCGSVPAAKVTFRGHQGIIVFMRFLSLEGPFCRDCGLGTFRAMTSRTLVQGWYGYASFIITPFVVLINLVRRSRVASLPAPHPNPYAPSRPPMDPGPRLLERPMTWLGLCIPFGLAFLLFLLIVTRGS